MYGRYGGFFLSIFVPLYLITTKAYHQLTYVSVLWAETSVVDLVKLES